MKFELNEHVLRVIDMGLQELPVKVALPVLNEINRQIEENRQNEAAQGSADDQ